MEYTFLKFTKDELPEFSKWLKNENVRRHIYIDDAEIYIRQSYNNPDYRMFSVYKNSVLTAHFSGERNKNEVSVCLIVKPELCKKGIGTEILRCAVKCSRELFGNIERLTAYIYNDNISSIRCFEKVGFIFSKTGEDGENIYICNINI